MLAFGEAALWGTPVARHHRNGFALRAALDPPAAWVARLPAWLVAGLTPLVSLGGAFDADHLTPARASGHGRDTDHWGAELGLANVVFGRVGDVHGEQSSNGTWGYGLALPVGRFGGFRFDHAVLRGAEGFGDTRRNGWTLWLDPVGIWRKARR